MGFWMSLESEGSEGPMSPWLQSKVLSLERLYPLSPVEASESQANITSEEMLSPQTILCLKTVGSKEIVDTKEFWAKINFRSKYNFETNFGPKRNLEKKIGVWRKFLVQNFFSLIENIRSTNNFGFRIFWVQRNRGSKKNLGQNKSYLFVGFLFWGVHKRKQIIFKRRFILKWVG